MASSAFCKQATCLIVCAVCRSAWWPLCRRWSNHGRMTGQLVAPNHERNSGHGAASTVTFFVLITCRRYQLIMDVHSLMVHCLVGP